MKFLKDKLFNAFQKTRPPKVSFEANNLVPTSRPLQFIHMDLFSPSSTKRFGGNHYALAIIDMGIRNIKS